MRQILSAMLLAIPTAAAGIDNSDVPEGLKAALQEEVAAAHEPESCLGVEFPQAIPWIGHAGWGRAPLEYGQPPFENTYAPGLFSVVLPSEAASAAYLRLRARMDLFTELGYFTAEPMTYVYPATEPVHIKFQTYGATQTSGEQVLPVEQLRRPQAAIRYTLTRQGWVATRGKPCLPIGKNELIEVLSVKQVEENRQQLAVVEYRFGVKPEGMSVDRQAVVRAFGEQVDAVTRGRSVKTTFFRTATGWVSERRMQALLRSATLATQQLYDAVDPPSAQALRDAIAAHVAGTPRKQACIRLPFQSQVHEGATRWDLPERQQYSASFYDFPDAHPERARTVSKGLALARDLQRIGVLSVHPATPFILSQPDELGGARFDLKPELYRYLNRESESICLAYAELAFEPSWIRLPKTTFNAPTAEFLGIATISRPYEWIEANESAKSFSLMRHVQEYGLGMKGTATLTAQGWRIQRMEILEPAYAAQANFKELFAALPRQAEYRKWNAAKTTPEIQAIVVRSSGTARVSVQGTGRPLILHLSSALPVDWKLAVSKHARLKRVVASTPTQARVSGVPPGIPVEIHGGAQRDKQLDKTFIPPLVPPGARFFGSGVYSEAGGGSSSANVDLIESRLGGELTVVQSELGQKTFSVPRRWHGGERLRAPTAAKASTSR